MDGSPLEQVGTSKSRVRGSTLLSLVPKALAAGAVLVSIGAVSLHLCGWVAQRSFLRAFNVDPDEFPRTADWMMVNGYFTVINVGASLLKHFISWYSLILVAYLAVVFAAIRWRASSERSAEPLFSWREKSAAKLWISSAFLSAFTVASAYLLFPVTLLVILVPGYAGETVGEERAEKVVALYMKGCSQVNPCSEIWSGEVRKAKGFVVASSPERLAFYDVDMKVARLFDRDGLEVRSPIDPRYIKAGLGSGGP